jgi:hypothetical protein
LVSVWGTSPGRRLKVKLAEKLSEDQDRFGSRQGMTGTTLRAKKERHVVLHLVGTERSGETRWIESVWAIPHSALQVTLKRQVPHRRAFADVAVVGSEADLFDLVSQAGSRLPEKLGVEAVSPVEAVSVRASLPSNREAAQLYTEGLARLRAFDGPRDPGSVAGSHCRRSQIFAGSFRTGRSLVPAWLWQKSTAGSTAGLGTVLHSLAWGAADREGRYREIGHEYEKAVQIRRTLFALFPDNLDYGLKLAAAQVLDAKGPDALATVQSLRKLSPPASELSLIDLQEAAAWEAIGDFKHQADPLMRAVT